ncbi:MAG: hypothetical protein R6W73_00825 [Candidatus Saliniplasma sp.]
MGRNAGLEMFKETHEFYKKYGFNARLSDLTEGSLEFLRNIEEKLTNGYHRIIGSEEIRRKKKKLGVKNKEKHKWKCTANTSTFAARTLPYFPKKLGKLLRNGSGSFYDCVDDELVDYMKKYWDMRGGSGTSRKKRVESINKCTGRGGDTSRGYLLFPWEKVPSYFNPRMIREVGSEDFLGGKIEINALERMCKNRKFVLKYYPNFKPFEFHRKYELSGKNVRFIPVHQINVPERWELYI